MSIAENIAKIRAQMNEAAIAAGRDPKEILLCDEINIQIGLNQGDKNAVAWGCDLTYDYVKINGDYRT